MMLTKSFNVAPVPAVRSRKVLNVKALCPSDSPRPSGGAAGRFSSVLAAAAGDSPSVGVNPSSVGRPGGRGGEGRMGEASAGIQVASFHSNPNSIDRPGGGALRNQSSGGDGGNGSPSGNGGNGGGSNGGFSVLSLWPWVLFYAALCAVAYAANSALRKTKADPAPVVIVKPCCAGKVASK